MANLLAELRGTPGWVKVFGVIAIVLVLLVVLLLTGVFGGEHGPRRHIPPEANSGRTLPTEHGVQQP